MQTYPRLDGPADSGQFGIGQAGWATIRRRGFPAILLAVALSLAMGVHQTSALVLTDAERQAAEQLALQRYQRSIDRTDQRAARGELDEQQREHLEELRRRSLYDSLQRLNETSRLRHDREDEDDPM
jgi:hypothetical protein